jgi:hypothetical protein
MKVEKFEILSDILHTKGLLGLHKYYTRNYRFIIFCLIASTVFSVFSAFGVIQNISYQVAYNELLKNHCIDKAYNVRVMEYNDSLKTYIISVQPKSYNQ